MFLSHEEEKGLIVKDPLYMGINFLFCYCVLIMKFPPSKNNAPLIGTQMILKVILESTHCDIYSLSHQILAMAKIASGFNAGCYKLQSNDIIKT